MKKLLRIVVDIFIILFFIVFLLSLLYFISGSLEMNPTQEQQGEVRLVSAVFLLFSALLCIVCIGIRMKMNKKQADE